MVYEKIESSFEGFDNENTVKQFKSDDFLKEFEEFTKKQAQNAQKYLQQNKNLNERRKAVILNKEIINKLNPNVKLLSQIIEHENEEIEFDDADQEAFDLLQSKVIDEKEKMIIL